MSIEQIVSPQAGKALLDATRPYAVESMMRSWWCVGSTLAVLGVVLVTAAIAPWWPLRLGASILGSLLLVRSFILYHDFMHRSLLRQSQLAKAIFYVFGLLMLTPPRYWRYSHNFHHANVGKPIQPEESDVPLMTSDIGSFPLMSTEMWREASWGQRVKYRLIRHPLTILGAYVTVFLFGVCLIPLFRDPKKYWDGALAVPLHIALVATIWATLGFATAFLSLVLPFAIAAAIGAYLFFAQHNYEGMSVLQPEDWTYYRGATESSSFMNLDPLLHWFTGNIGYHHIHHLNPLIPFYRLPEVMAAVPELQEPMMTSLRPRDIAACLRLNLWDKEKRRLVGYGDAARSQILPT
jgi:omega-6 fatty acid desaturase (delta-12 desaturase)